MGFFEHNTHLFIEEKNPQEILHRAINLVQQGMETAGYQLTDSIAESQHTLRFVTEPGIPWISFYTPPKSDLHEFHFETILSQLSYTVHLEDHDSDTILLHLYSEGMLLDEFSYGALNDYEDQTASGDTSKWIPVLPSSVTIDILEAAWRPDTVDRYSDPETILNNTLDVLDIPQWRFWEARETDVLPESAQVTTLRFRYAQPLPYHLPLSGLPRFGIFGVGGLGGRRKKVNEESSLGLYLKNLGGAGDNFKIILSGEAVETEALIPLSLKASYEPNEKPPIVPENLQSSKTQNTIYRFMLETPILAGIDWDAVEALPWHARDLKMEMYLRGKLQYDLRFKMLREGKFPLKIFITPLQNLEQGIGFTIEIRSRK